MGANFSVGLLEAVHPMGSSALQLEADLQALAAARFLRPDDAAPGAWAWCQARTTLAWKYIHQPSSSLMS